MKTLNSRNTDWEAVYGQRRSPTHKLKVDLSRKGKGKGKGKTISTRDKALKHLSDSKHDSKDRSNSPVDSPKGENLTGGVSTDIGSPVLIGHSSPVDPINSSIISSPVDSPNGENLTGGGRLVLTLGPQY